ncbi:MAG: sulfotransferase domain-containing protein [Planctomycetota bacterium]
MKRRYFCLRGFMKSGTNWLGGLLASHPDVGCVGEFHWQTAADSLAQNFRDLPVYQEYAEKNLKEVARDTFEGMVRACLDQTAPGKAVIGERTPHRLEPLILKDAPHISIIRDGRDVLVSRAFHLFNYPEVHRLFERIPTMAKDFEEFKKNPWFFKENPEMLLRHELMVKESVRWWCEHLEADRQTIQKHPFLKVRFVRYEDLHADTTNERNKLLEFLGVDPKLAPPIEGDLKAGFASERPDQFFRKGKIGDWRNYFTEQTIQWFKEVGGEELIRQKYEDSLAWEKEEPEVVSDGSDTTAAETDSNGQS